MANNRTLENPLLKSDHDKLIELGRLTTRIMALLDTMHGLGFDCEDRRVSCEQFHTLADQLKAKFPLKGRAKAASK